MKPFVKWAGGKRQILSYIRKYIDDSAKDNENYTYFEPFLGGGAVFFNLLPKKAVLNDLNNDLMSAYKVIKSDDYKLLIENLKELQEEYRTGDKETLYYEDIRPKDREESWKYATDLEKATRMIFLNRTCYNGLYRVNSKGEFNTPIGRYYNPTICDETNLKEVHDFLSTNDIKLYNESYESIIDMAKEGDIIYCDPPYDYEDDDGFTKYQLKGFTFDDFKKLKEKCDEAINRGAYVIISNNATTKVLDLFEKDNKYKLDYLYNTEKINTRRNINSNGNDRNNGKEVIIYGVNTNILLPQANDIEKVIKLALMTQEEIKDNNRIKEAIDVTTDRQVAYYLSALIYFDIINRNRVFKIETNYDRNKVENIIYNKLINDKEFKEIYNSCDKISVENNTIAKIIAKYHKELSESTINRRASTLKNYLLWVYQHEGDVYY